jgi:formate hydrogenlyase regulatory protein HycA
MEPPLRIPISREEEYYTHHIGATVSGGYFMAFVTANIGPLNYAILTADDWMRRKKWFSVIHHFDTDGKHLKSEIETHGTTADGEEAVVTTAWNVLNQKLAALGDVTYCDIAVQRFQVEYDGCTFGLLTAEECGMFDEAEDDEEMRYHIYLLPDDLVFYPPWTGEYDT